MLLILMMISSFAYSRVCEDGSVLSKDPRTLKDSLILLKNVALLDIKTDSGVEPTCDYIDKSKRPPGTIGEGIANCTKEPGRCVMYVGGAIIYDSGEFVKSESGMTIKIRGNTSALYSEKKPYKLKLQKKADLLFRDDPDHKIKDWVLLKGETLYEILSWELNRLLDYTWVPNESYVNVFLNDDYKGLYLLCEPIKRGSSLIDVDKDNGFIFEYDPYWWNEAMYVPSSIDYRFQYTFKYPEADDFTPHQVEYITDYCAKMEKAILEGGYDSYIDVKTFALWMIGHDVLGTGDGAGTNKYFVKEQENGLVKMGPMWDFDSIEMENEKWSKIHDKYPFGTTIFGSVDNTFMVEYVNQWNDCWPKLKSGIEQWLESFSGETNLINDLNFSREKNSGRWNYDLITVEDELEKHNLWFSKRFAWLNVQIAKLGATSIFAPINNSSQTTKNKTYDLRGMQTMQPHGAYIRERRVYIK